VAGGLEADVDHERRLDVHGSTEPHVAVGDDVLVDGVIVGRVHEEAFAHLADVERRGQRTPRYSRRPA
jgi:hypothetical protein